VFRSGFQNGRSVYRCELDIILDENSSGVDARVAKVVPGMMYIAGADTVSEVSRSGLQALFS
jgi:hypothetical protein